MRTTTHMTHQPILIALNLLTKLPPRIISHYRLDLKQQILERFNVLSRTLHVAVAFAEESPPIGLLVGDWDHETGDAVVLGVEGDDADHGGGIFASGEVGCIFCWVLVQCEVEAKIDAEYSSCLQNKIVLKLIIHLAGKQDGKDGKHNVLMLQGMSQELPTFDQCDESLNLRHIAKRRMSLMWLYSARQRFVYSVFRVA